MGVAQLGLFGCESVDLFAGGGGASLGILRATGRAPSVAINHDPAAIQMHAANHPGTLHLCESVFDVAPFRPRGRDIDLLWLSPDCTHHSKAKGGKPLDNFRRGLASIGVTWARAVRPRVIGLENVREWLAWGPLYPSDHPDPKLRDRPIPERRGEFFRAWVADLVAEGYRVEWRLLVAADYGAPTTRERLFLLARCDGRPIVWPEPTHGGGRASPWRQSAECIDWSIPCPSIFGRRKPLAEATQRRIAEGVRRFVLTSPPFIAPSRRQPAGDRRAKVAAFLAKHNGGTIGQSLREPVHTVTTRDTKALVEVGLGDGERAGEVAALMTLYYGSGGQWSALSEPMRTVVTKARMGLVTVDLDGKERTLTDIGMRMLTPRELARAQGFGDDYLLTGSIEDQIARIGNSAPPDVVEALVRAQFSGARDPVSLGMVA